MLEFKFGDFLLDVGSARLRHAGEDVSVEPQVLDLLTLFARNPGEVITRERMLAELCRDGTATDAALAAAIKAARQALGDDAGRQSVIETVRGQGFRLRLPVGAAADEAPAPQQDGPSIAVLPFARLGESDRYPGLEEAIPHEVLVALSRLRWLLVIARNSSFQFHGDRDMREIGRALGVGYAVTGIVEVFGPSITIGATLADCATGGIVWADRFSGRIDDLMQLRAEIVAGVTGAIDTDLPLHEARRALARAPEDLDAWQLFHLGLKSVHQYTAVDNAAAEAYFRRAVELQPTFARAHAGLSFATFQNAFMGYVSDRRGAIEAAHRQAETGISLDPMDPFANFVLGRSLWLQKDLDGAVTWLERAVSINPNYAQGIYTRALIDTLSGRSLFGTEGADQAMRLSPLDPLLYGMRGVKALAGISRGDYAAAADWAGAAARTPRAHVIIDLIAAVAHHLSDDRPNALHWASVARERKPDVTAELFFDGLPIADPPLRAQVAASLADLGFGATSDVDRPASPRPALPTATARIPPAGTDPAPRERFALETLGAFRVRGEAGAVALPRSRKTLALLAYLAVTGKPQRRERLCEMLWERPDDPRGALRWSLSKIRRIIAAGPADLVAERDTIHLDTGAVDVDYRRVAGLHPDAVREMADDRIEEIVALYRGGFLEDLSLGDCPDFEAWRIAVSDETDLVLRAALRELVARFAETDPARALQHAHALRRLEPADRALGATVEALRAAANRA